MKIERMFRGRRDLSICKMKKEYYPTTFSIRGKVYFVIWYDNGHQCFALDKNGMILAFNSFDRLEQYLASINEQLAEKEMVDTLDIDEIDEWIKRPKENQVNCDLLLSAWNMFGDIRSSIEGRNMDREDTTHLEVYDKLFYGSDAGWFATGKKKYTPKFSVKDIREIRAVLKEGMKLFQSRFDPKLAQ